MSIMEWIKFQYSLLDIMIYIMILRYNDIMILRYNTIMILRYNTIMI
jgi:hypothetical protein